MPYLTVNDWRFSAEEQLNSDHLSLDALGAAGSSRKSFVMISDSNYNIGCTSMKKSGIFVGCACEHTE